MWRMAEGSARRSRALKRQWGESIWWWGTVIPAPGNHTWGDASQHLHSHPFQEDQQCSLWTSFSNHRDSHPLLNQLQKQKMSQDPLGMLVSYLSKDTVLYGCGYWVLSWITFILLVICRFVSCWLLALSHTVRNKKGKKKKWHSGYSFQR